MVTHIEEAPVDRHDVPVDEFDFSEMPPALVVEESDEKGVCASCGNTTYRPSGTTATGRRKRVPKYCADCAKAPAATAKRVATRKATSPDIRDGMTGLYESLGMLLAFKDPELTIKIVGMTRINEIAGSAEEGTVKPIAQAAGDAWAHVAATNPKVAEALIPLLKTSVWSELVTAHAPIIGHVVAKKPKLKLVQKLRMRAAARRGQQADTDA